MILMNPKDIKSNVDNSAVTDKFRRNLQTVNDILQQSLIEICNTYTEELLEESTGESHQKTETETLEKLQRINKLTAKEMMNNDANDANDEQKLLNSLKTKKQEIRDRDMKIENLETQIAGLKETLRSEERDSQNKDNTIKELQRENENSKLLATKCKELEANLQKLKFESEARYDELVRQNDEKMKKKNDAIQTMRSKLKMKIEETPDPVEINRLNAEIRRKDNEIEHLNEKYKNLNEAYEEKSDEDDDRYVTLLSNIRTKVREKDVIIEKIETEITDYECKVRVLEKKIKIQNILLTDAKNELAEAERLKEDFETKYKKLLKKTKDLEMKVAESESNEMFLDEIKNLKAALRKEEMASRNKDNTIDELQRENENGKLLTTKCKELEANLQKVKLEDQEKYDELVKSSEEEMKSFQENLRSEERDSQNKNNTIKELQRENENGKLLTTKCKELEANLQKVKFESEARYDELVRSSEEEIKKKHDAIQTMRTKMRQKNEEKADPFEIKRLNADIKRKDIEIEHQHEKYENINAAYEKLGTENDMLKKDINTLKSDLDNMKRLHIVRLGTVENRRENINVKKPQSN